MYPILLLSLSSWCAACLIHKTRQVIRCRRSLTRRYTVALNLHDLYNSGIDVVKDRPLPTCAALCLSSVVLVPIWFVWHLRSQSLDCFFNL
jgi:hypothetical protein